MRGSSVDDIYRINVRNEKGEMIPLRSLVEVRVGPQALIRYNNRLAVTVRRFPRPVSRPASAGGDGSGCRPTLPRGYRGDWTDISFGFRRNEPRARRLGFAILFAYLFLVVVKLDHPRCGANVGVGWPARSSALSHSV